MDIYNSIVSFFIRIGIESSLIPNFSLVTTCVIFGLILFCFTYFLISFIFELPFCLRSTLFIRTENGYHLRYAFPFKSCALRYAKRYNKKHITNNILYIVAVNDKNYLNSLCSLSDNLYIDDLKFLYLDSRLCSIYNVRFYSENI